VIGAPFADTKVKFATTQPGPEGPPVAFAAEFLISFILMMALLMAINSERLEKAAGAIAAGLIGIYIAVESPLSGMSLNPARSLGSALTVGQWNGLWVYFIAPMMATLLAAEVYMMLQRTGFISGRDTTAGMRRYRIIGDYKAGPDYPVENDETDEGQRG